MGLTWAKAGELPKALEHYRKALSIKHHVLSPNNPSIGFTYNNLGTVFRQLGNFDSALYYVQASKDIVLNNLPLDELSVAMNDYNLGVIYKQLGEYDIAEKYYVEALNTRLRMLPEIHLEIGKSYYALGSIALEKRDLGNALKYVTESRKIWLALDHPQINYTNILLGVIYAEMGDYANAIQFNLLAAETQIARTSPTHPLVAGCYNNIANIYQLTGDYSMAETYTQKALDIQLQILPKKHPHLSETYLTLSAIYLNLGKYKEAISSVETGLNITQSLFGENYAPNAYAYQIKGEAQIGLGQAEAGLNSLRKGLSLLENAGLMQHTYRTEILHALANWYTQNGNWQKAADYLQTARSVFRLPLDKNWQPHTLPSLQPVYAKPIFLENLKLTAKLFEHRYQQNNRYQDLDTALLWYQRAVDLVDSMHLEYRLQGSRENLSDKAEPIYDGAIHLSAIKYEQSGEIKWLEQALRLAEKNKSSLLYQALKESQARKFSGIPLTVTDFEQKLNQQLYDVEKSLTGLETGGQSSDPELLAELRSQKQELRRQYDSLITDLEIRFPAYYQLKYDLSSISLSEVQQALPDDQTAFLEYFIGPDHQYVFLIGKNTTLMQQLEGLEDPAGLISSFRKQIIVQDGAVNSNQSDLAQSGWELYERLFPFQDTSILPAKLRIIPDGILGYLPFDALLYHPVSDLQYRDWPYLIKKFEISYAYSLQLFIQGMHRSEILYTNSCLSIAP